MTAILCFLFSVRIIFFLWKLPGFFAIHCEPAQACTSSSSLYKDWNIHFIMRRIMGSLLCAQVGKLSLLFHKSGRLSLRLTLMLNKAVLLNVYKWATYWMTEWKKYLHQTFISHSLETHTVIIYVCFLITDIWSCDKVISHGPQPWASCQIHKIGGAHAPGMPGTFSPSPQVSDPDMHHGTCVTHVPWCMPGSLTSGFLWNRRRGKTFPAFPAHAQPAILRIW